MVTRALISSWIGVLLGQCGAPANPPPSAAADVPAAARANADPVGSSGAADPTLLAATPNELEVIELGRDVLVVTSEPYAVNSLLVRTLAGPIVLVDSPMTPADTEALISLVRERWGAQPKWAFNSHWHTDATAGNQVLVAHGIEVISSGRTAAALREGGVALRDDLVADFSQRDPEIADKLRALVPTPATRVVTIDGSLALTLGGEPIVLVYPGASHSADSIGVYFPERKLLYGGCAVRSNGAIGNRREADYVGWIHAMDTFEQLGPQTVIPGHGRRFDPAMLAETRAAAQASLAERRDGDGQRPSARTR